MTDLIVGILIGLPIGVAYGWTKGTYREKMARVRALEKRLGLRKDAGTPACSIPVRMPMNIGRGPADGR